ncbi:MAG: lipid-A-disaccharide synthase [Bacteroidales bacterium]|nr:lipid-A-disaccharide synthase [Bacteroidales bacterium]
MRYYIIAGEASGDLHAANLMHELKNLDKDAEFRVWGGDLMQQQGGQIVKHYKELAFMGFVEVLMNIRRIKSNFELCQTDLLDFKPDILILVDYPGFNLRMAKFAKENNIRTYYYISPKIWAWKKSRAWKIKKYIDKMFVIFPFEKKFYKQYNYEVEYVGNPLIDELKKKKEHLPDKETFLKRNKLSDKPIIALLAGSRKQELKYILPEMLKVMEHFHEYQFVLAGAPGFDVEVYRPYIEKYPVKLIFNQTYDLLKHAKAAIVTSGTATLETALFNVPQVVVYKMNRLTYEVGKYFIKPKFFSLVNIVMDRTIVQELLQKDLPQKITDELSKILYDEQYCYQMLESYKELQNIIGDSGASRRTAEIIYSDLNS